ncbi:MAG: phytoene/squalene synthase family protein [Pseudomonadota bacterium]
MTQDSNQWEPGQPPGPTTSSSENSAPSPPPSSPSPILADDGPDATDDDIDYCTRLVRRYDLDRYLATLFAPKELRPALLGLYAFNIELGLIRENVTDPNFGEMRLQWWRDTITEIFRGNLENNPVARALSDAIMLGRLTKPGLLNMIEARTFDLYDDPMPELNDLEGYLGETVSAVFLMASFVLCRGEDINCAEAAGYAGIAHGITGLLRSLPVHTSRGQCYLPAELMERFEVTIEDLRTRKGGEGFPLLIRRLCSHTEKRLTNARDRLSTVPTEAIPAFLPVCLVDIHLTKILGAGPELLRRPPELSQMRRQWRLLRFALREEY